MKQTIVIYVTTGFFSGYDELLGMRQVESTEAAFKYIEELTEKEVEFRGEKYPAGLNFKLTMCGPSNKPNYAFIDYDNHGKMIERKGYFDELKKQPVTSSVREIKDYIKKIENDTDTQN